MNEFEFAYNLIALLKAEYQGAVITGLRHYDFSDNAVETELTLPDGTKLMLEMRCEQPEKAEQELTEA